MMQDVSNQILVVDGDVKVTSSFQNLLGQKYKVATASSSIEASLFLEANHNVAVIVAALNLPGVDGERALLEKTLAGTVKILIETLSLFHADAFRKTAVLRQWALQVGKVVGVKRTWELEMAMMFSPLGEALLPKDILSRYRSARSLTDQQRCTMQIAAMTARGFPLTVRLARTFPCIHGS